MLELYGHDILRWMHVIFAAYWLGGEWGVFNASTNVANAKLSFDERMRHMDVAFKIDILPRSSIILLLPVGFHMAANLGVSPITGIWVPVIWVAVLLWWGLMLMAYRHRGTDLGMTLTNFDTRIRYFVVPALMISGLMSLFTGAPYTALWFAAKLSIFSFLLIIGLYLRYVMKAWVVSFRKIAAEGSTPEVEKVITDTLARARILAYIYWVGIATVAFLGIAKPF